jgi:hypothetical protein
VRQVTEGKVFVVNKMVAAQQENSRMLVTRARAASGSNLGSNSDWTIRGRTAMRHGCTQ